MNDDGQTPAPETPEPPHVEHAGRDAERAEHAEHAEDDAEAFELTPRPAEPERVETPLDRIEALALGDPGDDELRGHYLRLASSEGEQLRAANALARAAGANGPAVRERIWYDAATLYMQEAELPQARSAFMQSVLAGAGGAAGLAAARRVLDLDVEPHDPDVAAPALAFIAAVEPDEAARHDAARRLLAMHPTTALDDERLAVALQALPAAESIAWLSTLRARDPERATSLGRAAIEADPSGAAWLETLDAWLAGEPPADRIARYEAALAHAATPDRRVPILRTLAALRRESPGDLPAAVQIWQQLLAEDPSDREAIEGLLAASTKLDDGGAALAAVAQARPALRGRARHDVTVRTARALSRQGRGAEAVAMCRELMEDPGVASAVLQAVAEIAHDEDDAPLHAAALGLLVNAASPESKPKALERMGDFQIAQLRDPRAAAESWRAAAKLCAASPAEAALTQSLYERVIEALPDDCDAAEHLTAMHRQSGDWSKLPVVLRVLIRTATTEEEPCLLLLDLERSAIERSAAEEYVLLVDEVVARLAPGSTERARALKRSRARVLTADPARQDQASRAHREIVEAYGLEEDVRVFEAFVDARASALERHEDRRWLYRWRAGRDPRPIKVLLDWARAEDEFGETEAAIAVYQRLADLDPGRREALEALCRLKLHSGDLEGGLASLQALRDTATESDRRGVILRMARLLLEEMGRPAEAALALAPLFDVEPPIAAAHQMLQRTLADAGARAQVVERLEQLAEGADRPTRVRVYGFLLKARDETATMGEARRRWHERLVDLEEQPAAALQAAVDGAVEFPAVTHLWETAETVARSHGLGEAVSRAYHKVLVEGALAPALTESIARRMLAFEDEVGAASPRLVEALQRTLEVSPGARWAIDRVKLMLGSQARWDELFRVYDRAIAASGDDGERSALLGEAAFAAKDLAAQPERAIVYLESIHALRPDDVTVDAALERLYEKQGQTSALIELLDERLARRTGFQHRELLRKLASLWMDLGGAEEAIAIVDRLLVDGAPVGELTDLLERVAGAPSVARSVAPSVAPPPAAPDASSAAAQKRALALLRAHYESAARIEDVVRMAERELALAGDAEKRAACVRDLVGLRLTAAERTASTVFAHVVPLVEADVKADPQLAKVAFEALLQRALVAWKQPASPARDDASEGAWQTIHLLTALLLEHGKGEAALNLLVRIGRLPFERARRRELAREAAVICADRLDDGARAIKLFGELFEEDGGDEVAARSLQSFAALLAKAGELARLASLWEAQAVVHEKAGRPAAQRACFERAAALWEKQADMPRAIAAYGQAGKLGSAAAFEALSGIHAGRGDWAAAAEALQWLFDHAPPEARSGRALRLAEACAAVGDRGRARAVLEGAMPAAAGDPDAEKVPERLLALYREDAAWRPLAKLLAAQARRPGHAERRLAWLREASDLHWRKLDEPAEAAALLELAVSWYPQDTTHRPALADVFESVGQWDKAAAALRGQVALHRDQRSRERALVHQRLAHALAHTIGKAGRADEALAELRLAAEMHPTHPGILFDLGRGALSTGQLELAESTYRALLLALHSSAPSNGDGEAGGAAPHPSEVFIELSEIAARNDDAARAADLLDSAVDAALESGEDPKRFEAPLAGRGRHDLLARAAERRVERAATLGARAVALHDLAGLWVEHLARAPEMGARIARHAERMSRELEHEGLTDGAAWTALSEAHQALGDETARIAIVRRRADLLAAAIPGLPRGDERNRLRVELARTLLGDPAKTDEALKLLASAVEEDPARHKAADLLADALEKRERFADLARLLERRHAVEHPAGGEGASGPEAAASALRLARALDRADLPKEALPVYESIIDRLPADSLQAVVDRLAALGSERLADGLERMLALEGGGGEGSGAGSKAAADAGKTVDLAQRLLDLRDRAGDAAGARRALELGFAADPANKAFFRRLVAAYRDAGDRGATLRLLDPAVAARPDDVDLLLLRSQAREHLGDDDGALFDLETAAVADHRQVDTLVSLHERVLERQTARAEGGPLPATADVFAIRVIDVLLDGKRLDDARRELDRLLARTPDHADALERLAPLQLADGQWAAAVETYRKLLPVAEAGDGGDRERLVRVALAMADACERAGDAGASRDALERALAGAPESHEIMQRLERVCEVTGDVGRLANLLVSHAARLDDREERGRLLVRAANLLLDGAADPPGALRAAELALAANPESLEAVLAWAGAQRRGGHPHEAVAAIDRATSRAKGKRTPLLARLHLEAARAHLAVDEVVEAFESLKAGFAMDWRNPELSLLLGLVAIDLDDEKVAERALVGLTTTRDTGAGADLSLQANGFYRLALLAHARGDRAKTRRMAGRAIALEPEHAATRALLEQVEPAGGSSANRSGPRPALTPRS